MSNRRKYKRQKYKIQKSIFISQIFVSVVVTALIMTVKNIKTSITQTISNNIQNTLHYNVDFNETSGELKKIFNDIKKEVLKNDNAKEKKEYTESSDNT